MLRFTVGDRVVVAAPTGYEPSEIAAGLHANRLGVIIGVDETETLPYPYDVQFESGGRLAFADDELIHEADAELATAGFSVSLNLDAREMGAVNHPSHYTWLPGDLEVIDITKNFGFVRGNALKYLFRADHKGRTIEDLKKARWYIDYEIKQLEAEETV